MQKGRDAYAAPRNRVYSSYASREEVSPSCALGCGNYEGDVSLFDTDDELCAENWYAPVLNFLFVTTHSSARREGRAVLISDETSA